MKSSGWNAPISGELVPVFFSEPAEVTEFLKYELPEMKIFNFSDPGIDSLSILKEIQEDPWLHYGGIIGIHDGCRRQDAPRGDA